jgi:NADPH2:quinone reductase
VVEAIGANVEEFKVGDRVYIGGTKSGAYAELALCDAAQIYNLPDALSFAQGAAIHVPYATAYRALFLRGAAKAGETLLVHGATGGVGIAAVQLGVSHGLTVFGTGGTAEGRQLVKEQGASEVFDHHAPGYLEAIKAATDGEGVDIILEMLANVNLGNDLGLLARNGRVVVVGNRGTVEINPRDTMSRDAAILGMTLLNASAQELRSIHSALGEGFRDGSLKPIIGQETPLAEAARAHREIMEGGAQGKMVLVP